jgi:intracellular sulfur oxidation DsrE/DsrF family protein
MHDFAGKGAIIQTEMAQTWELLTEEQKRKVAVMGMGKGIKFLEMKINDMEKMIEIKKDAIANIRKVQEMIQQGKC